MLGESPDSGPDPVDTFEDQARATGLTLPKRRPTRLWEVGAIVAAVIVVSVGIGVATGWMNLKPASEGPPGLIGTGSCSNQAGQRVALMGTTSQDADPLLSSSLQELTGRFTAAYGSCVRIAYTSPNASAGLGAMADHEADFAVLQAQPSAAVLAELPQASYVIPIGVSSVSVVYNLPGVTLPLHLNGSILAQMYSGGLTAWNAPAIRAANPGVELPSGLAIVPIHRSDPAPINAAFTGYLANSSASWNNTVGQGAQVSWPAGPGDVGEAGVASAVANVSGAISYVATGSSLPATVATAELEDPSGSFVASTPTTVAAAADASFNATAAGASNWTGISLLNAAGNDSYPLSYLVYLVVYQDLGVSFGGNLTLLDSQWEMTFLWWVVTDGGYVTAPLGFDQLPTAVVAPAQTVMEKVNFNGKSVLESTEAGESGGETGEF